MYRMRSWSVRNARWLKALYGGFNFTLQGFNPVLSVIGYERLDAGVAGQQTTPPTRKKSTNALHFINQLQEIENVHGVHIMAYCQEHRVAEIVERSNVLHGRELWHPGESRNAEPALN